MLHFEPVQLGPEMARLRDDVRSFLAESLPDGPPGLGMLGGRSPAFSRALAERGWVGMAIPKRYGGHGRSAIERFVVLEELLAVGAPVLSHWVADRQIAPSLLAWGTEEQRRSFLPRIASGELSFALGLSEPDSGSDLASVTTSAQRVEGGWSLTGTKIWTSGAAHSDFIVVLCRTSPRSDDRHQGLTQFIVDLRSEGITVNPIITLDGRAEFNEVVFDDVHLDDECLLGTVGHGWTQITTELGHERGGPDRILSSYQLLAHLLAALLEQPGRPDALDSHEIGGMLARLWGVRQLSLSVADALDRNVSIGPMAAIVKDLGTTLEQDMVEVVARLEPEGSARDLHELLGIAVLNAPSYTIRGGTTEMLRTVASRSLEGTS